MNDDELDRILDQGLRSYSSAEPLAGLEQRTLSRARAARQPRAWGWLRWAVVLSVFACALIVAVAFWPKHERVRQAYKSALGIAESVPKLPAAPKVVEARVRKQRPKPLPKLERFPSPAPLTDEERALLAFVARTPSSQEIPTNKETQSLEPLEIAEIHIEPLESKGDEKDENLQNRSR